MTNHRTLSQIRRIVLVAASLVSVTVLGQGCNTTQAPNRQVTDLQITTQVKSKLASGVGASSLTDIDVNTTNGVVTLAGQVQSAEVKHEADTVVAAVPGVVKVNDDLQVAAASASR